MTPALYGLGRLCVRYGWAVIALWIVLVVGAVVLDRTQGDNLADNLTLPGTDSQSATDLLSQRFPTQANGSVPIVFVAPSGGNVNDSAYKNAITSVYDAYAKDPPSSPPSARSGATAARRSRRTARSRTSA